jgi:5-formyltetrahydrofolate cyclo-ligase
MHDDKARLRRQARQIRGTTSPQTLQAAGRAVAPRVLAWLEQMGARSVLVYVSVRRELPTGPTLQALWARGLTVAVPRIEGQTMQARRLSSDDVLVDGAFGVPTSEGPLVERIDAVLCPGLSFTVDGARLGYGGGFYDRFLATHPHALPAGLCVDEAVVDWLPVEPHDVRMHTLVTPTRRLRCNPDVTESG